MDAEIQALSDTLIAEIFNAVGFSKTGLMRQLLGRLFQKPANRLSTIGITADRMIAKDGFSKAAGWMLTNWCRLISARGTETIPHEGPLLVVSNHAGSYDTFVIASQLGREDLKFISSDIPFLKYLPNASEHIFFLSDNIKDRMAATRKGMRHLKAGGALLLYGTGLVDPDPEVYPDAEAHLENWSNSINLFLKHVPDAKIVVTLVSGVLSKYWGHHPITWLRRIGWQKRRLAEFGQVLQQLFSPGKFYLTPSISFAKPVTATDLQHESGTEQILPAVIARAKKLLAEHQAWLVERANHP